MPPEDNVDNLNSAKNGSAQQNNAQSIVNPDGTFVENWSAKYGKEAEPTLSRFNKFDDLVTSHMALRKKYGHDPDSMVVIPKDDSTDETKQAFWKAAGELEKPEDYKFTKAKELSDKVLISDEQVKAFTQVAKKYHLNQLQFNGILNDYLFMVQKDVEGFEVSQNELQQQAFDSGMAELKKVFRDGTDARTKRANALLVKYGNVTIKTPDGKTSSVMEKLFEESPKLKNSPWMTMFLDSIAESMSEDSLKGISGINIPTSGQLQNKINELKLHPAYLNQAHPQHRDIVNQLTELYKKKTA